MKLSKTTRLVVVIGIFVVAAIALGMLSSQGVKEQNQLSDKLAATQANLQKIQLEPLSAKRAELEGQLGRATAQFEVVKTIFPQSVESVTVTTDLFNIANAYGVKVTEMTSSGLASDNLAGVTYSVISLTAKIEGDLPNLVSFVARLSSYFVTGAVKSITITVPKTSSGEKASADIQLAIYTYQGE